MIKKFLSRLFSRPEVESAPTSATRSSSAPAKPEAPSERQTEPRHSGDQPRPSRSRSSRGPRERGPAGSGQRGRGNTPAAEPNERPARQPETAPPEATNAETTDAPRKRRRRRKPSSAQGEAAKATAAPAIEAMAGPQARDAQFGSVAVSEPIAKALADMGYVTPTPIQEAVSLPMLAGQDVVGQAQTGTGKTAGFGIPLAEAVDGTVNQTQAIVLVPTRELAQQVTAELTKILKYRGARIVAVYGGAPIARQIAGLEAGAHVVVGTPGRVIDLLDRGVLRIDRVRTVVLDEADQMLDIGFLPDIRRILRSTPRERQTALFSATVPTMIRRLVYSYLRDPQWIRVGEESETVESVRQMYCEVARRDKFDALQEVLREMGEGEQALIFRRTQEDVDWLVRTLKRKRIAVEAIHGGLAQGERNAVMEAFRAGKIKLLVSTNLTSRGIDVPTVAHVINYDIPDQVEEYVHRIGRTARMGREGTAVTFVSEWDLESFDAIREHVGAENLEEMKVSLYQPEEAREG